MKHQPIGKILTQICGLSREALEEGLKIQSKKGGRIGKILIKNKAISESDLLKALARHFQLRFFSTLSTKNLKHDFTTKVPIQFLRKYNIVPIYTNDSTLIAVNDPLLFQPLDDICKILDLDRPEIVIAPRSAILSAINTAYEMARDSTEQVIEGLNEEDTDSIISEIQETGDILEDTTGAPIVKLVNLMFYKAVKEQASDIHIEPARNRIKVRFRLDGILYDRLSPPKHIESAFISRIKIMAKMNIAEKRLPQDGRIEIRIAERNIDVRVSTIPTAFGERVVLRLLDKSNLLLSLSDLGMLSHQLKAFERLIHNPYGIILVTGPTGSGKTTTLYCALSSINTSDINIITVEDPVEYSIEDIAQVQVNRKINLTFANGLRSIVRQDPDAILVGEIRDLETAEIAIQSALTGHLVFSTLHTNDSASAVTRLIDMGIEPFLVTSSVIAILAQRLVRVICEECREEYAENQESLRVLGFDQEKLSGKKIFRGRGCSYCMNTGYRGRTGLFELLIISDSIKSLISQTSDADRIRRAAVAQGMTTLREAGIEKVLQGITTIEEVLRVTRR